MPKHILVVDDVKDWQKTLSGLLADEGYKVQAVGDREAALAAVREGKFDLAVIDVRLDETDEENTTGLDLAGEVKQVTAGLPVIIITGYETPQTIARAMRPDESGEMLAANFVRKVDANELVSRVNEILGSPDS